MLTRDEFAAMIARIRSNAEQYPSLAAMLLANVPEGYDPQNRLAADRGLLLAAQRTARPQKRLAMTEAQALFMDYADDAIARFLSTERTLSDVLVWQEQMHMFIKEIHAEAYSIGKSGRWSEMGFRDWGIMGNTVRQQWRFLQGWVDQILAHPTDYTSVQMSARAKLYASAATQSLERGISSEIGIDPAILPAWPGDGSSECRSNDRCRWVFRILSKARGNYNATWKMRYGESCRTCRERAKKWKRLKIRGGLLVDPVEVITR
jgi:hypothetical protein